MSPLMNGYVLGPLIGAAWGVLIALVGGVGLTMVTGLGAAPALGAGLVAGAVSGLFLVIRPIGQRDAPARFIAAAIFVVVMLAATFGAPFAVPLAQSGPVQTVALIGEGLALGWAAAVCLAEVPAGPTNRRRTEIAVLRLTKGVGYVFFTVLVVLPFYVLLMTSFKNQQALLANPLDFSIDLSGGFEGLFSSYIELFTAFNFGRYMLIAAFVSVATVVLTLLFAVPGAYAVARLRFPAQRTLSRSILLIYMVPAIVLVIPLYAVFSQLGLRNSLIGLLIVYPATTLPVALYMLQGYFRGLPYELEEAGLMDGCSRLGVIWRITLPLSLPALASVSLYVFMIAWNEFLFAFMFLDDPDIFTLSRAVVSLNSSEVPRQHLMAGAVVATVPVLVIFLWFERFLVRGLTAGSVKG